MSDVLISRDGLISNSPRYAGYLSPPYKRYLKDDSGAAINLTGVPTGAFALYMVNQLSPTWIKTGGGSWTILNAVQGLVSYQYSMADLATPGNWYLFVTVQMPGETGQRAFDPDFLQINIPPGGLPIVTIQQVDLEQLLGAPISTGNPVPVAGPITIADGANVSQGATTDSSSANTQIGLLKAIKAYLAGTLTTSGATTETNSAAILSGVGTPSDAAWSGSGNGSEIAILKKLVAELAATLNVSVTNFPATQNVAGSVTANAGTNLNTSTLALETGGNLAAAKTDLDTIATNTTGIATQATLSAAKSDLDTLAGIVSSNKAAVKSATNDIVDLATLLTRITDNYGTNTAISAGTTFGSIPLVSALAANSYATLTNSSFQDTFIVQINVASAFNGTIGFYGLLPDGSTLQLVNAHQRNSTTNGNSTAINTSSALEQTWEGSIAGFKAVYVVCTAFTSGAATVQIGLTAANYAHAILNTVASNLTQLNGTTLSNTNPLPSQDIEQQGYIALTSPPTQTNAGSDTALTFSSQVNRVIIENNTNANVNYDYDQAASAGSFLVGPGGFIAYPKKCTALHLYTAAAQNINGTSAGNIIVRGAL